MKKKIIFILLLNFAFSQLSEKQDSLLKPLKKSSDAFLLQQDNNNIGSMIILDTEKSKFLWKGGLKFAVSNHDGNLFMSNGRISIENNIITGNISIDMKTISNNDLSSGSKERLVGHLKSSDFFYVSKYPKSKLEIKSSKVLEKLDNGKYKMLIEGDITIKNVTNPTTFEAIVDLDSKIKLQKVNYHLIEVNLTFNIVLKCILTIQTPFGTNFKLLEMQQRIKLLEI